jgi:arabinofuranosyltransferase
METQLQELKKGILPLSLLFFMAMVFRVAWVTEDAYIAFRSIDHFINGRGLVYNLAERVQVFTDPLYCLVLAVFALFTNGEYFYSSIALSMAFSLGTAWLVGYKLTGKTWIGAFSVLLLSMSVAFTEFSTSGLENSLSHILLAAFYVEFLTERKRRPFYLALLAALAATNRLDSLVFYLPALAFVFFKKPDKSTLISFLAGFSPLILWEGFSLVYYGFLVPNTAYAKLNLGVNGWEMLEQGCIYIIASITHDPVTGLLFGLLPVSLYLLLTHKETNPGLILFCGIAFKVIYVALVGGDYMLGRFLTEISLASLMLFGWLASTLEWKGTAHGLLVLLALGLSVAGRHSPFRSDLSYGAEGAETKFEWFIEGLVDERSFYYPQMGLANRGRFARLRIGSANQALDYSLKHELGESPVSVMGNAGVLGFYSAPELHLIDVHALCDPLLARLPLANDFYWRTGHYPRNLPEGYVETIKSGVNQIKDSSLAQYYNHLKVIVSGPVFSLERFKTILNINLGKYNHLIDEYLDRSFEVTYRHFQKIDGNYHYLLAQLKTPVLQGTDVNDVRVLKFWDHMGTVFLDVKEESHVRNWSALFSYQSKTAVRFFKGKNYLGTAEAIPQGTEQPGLQPFVVMVPKQAWEKGYDAMELVPHDKERRCATSGWFPSSDTVTIPSHLFFKSANTVLEADGFSMNPSEVFGIFGPYLPLPSNNYKLVLEFDRAAGTDFSILSNVHGSESNEDYANQRFANPENAVVVPFTLSKSSPKTEFRILYQSILPIPLKIKSIRLIIEK